jgi:hypothetical protein
VKKTLGADRARWWCPECKQYVQAVRPKDGNLITNLLLSVFTLGVWLIVWACTADLRPKGPPQCPICGTRTETTSDRDAGDELDRDTNDTAERTKPWRNC